MKPPPDRNTWEWVGFIAGMFIVNGSAFLNNSATALLGLALVINAHQDYRNRLLWEIAQLEKRV